jgi:predicted O-linked N-acetylglucosamine transferase (SPINDLY family)
MDFPQLLAAAAELEAGGCAAEAADLYRTWLEGNASDMAHVGYFNLGALLAQMGDLPAAESAYRQAAHLLPGFVQPRLNLATVLERMGRVDEAIAEWRWVCQAVSPQSAQNKPLRCMALNQLGRVLEQLQRDEEALQCLTESLSLDAQQAGPLQHWIALRQKLCIWPVYAPFAQMSLADMESSTSAMSMLALSDDPARQRAAAQGFVDRVLTPEQVSPPWSSGYRHARLRVAYLSSDWRAHPVAMLTVELLELHSRDKLEVFAYCWSPEDGSALRKRVVRAVDHFVPIAHLSDAQAAQKIRNDEIDILIDLQGQTAGARPQLLALRPAPVQISYLGFPGDSAMPGVDFVLADGFVLPPQHAPGGQRALYMPTVFQVSDRRRQAGIAPTRLAVGLPAHAFVFACFNRPDKFSPALFAVWMRILARVPDAVLWLLCDDPGTQNRLQEQAKLMHIDIQKIVFLHHLEHADYLSHIPVADLFLDTFPFNGGASTNDVLWMGVPLLTLCGASFAARMGAALLRASGMEELITYTHSEYEEAAVRLAQQPAQLAGLRQQAQALRANGSIFDTPRWVRDWENLLGSAFSKPGADAAQN